MIDVHAHIQSVRYREFLTQSGIRPPQVPPWLPGTPSLNVNPWSDSDADIVLRLGEMDRAGVEVQILSPTFAPYLDEEEVAQQAARVINTDLARLNEASDGRLQGFASLPLPHVATALAEIDFALGKLGMWGVTLQTACGHRSIVDDVFAPVFAELDRRAAVVFLHPCMNGLCSHHILDWRLEAAAGPIFEDTLVALQLIVADYPARYPSIKFIIPHLGGALPALLSRLDNQLPGSHSLSEPPSKSARRLWYDTCVHGSAPCLRMAADTLGTDRILVGTDYPFLTAHESYSDSACFFQRCGLSRASVESVGFRNAELMLGSLLSENIRSRIMTKMWSR